MHLCACVSVRACMCVFVCVCLGLCVRVCNCASIVDVFMYHMISFTHAPHISYIHNPLLQGKSTRSLIKLKLWGIFLRTFLSLGHEKADPIEKLRQGLLRLNLPTETHPGKAAMSVKSTMTTQCAEEQHSSHIAAKGSLPSIFSGKNCWHRSFFSQEVKPFNYALRNLNLLV